MSKTRTGPLPENLRADVMALAQSLGAEAAGHRLGIGRDTVARAAAGLPVRPSVAQLIAAKLEAIGLGEAARDTITPEAARALAG
jgi:hypothetical protein